jgi:glycosyltransferase involved in cell wall biosynthesis
LEALQQRLIGATSEAARRHIVETIGLVPGATARLSLDRVASDHVEAESVRVTAIAAFVERSTDVLPRSFSALARESGSLGRAVRLTRTQRHLILRGPRRAHDRSDGIRVAQIHLGAVLDASMSRAGMGDTGGVATLLSRLGSSLAAQPRVAEVVSIGRTATGAATVPGAPMAGHRFESVPLEDGEGATFASPWPSIVAAQRGIRSALLATGVPDVIHLRMADPGSLAGALVAQQLDIPTVFTLAPDPHGPIADAERRGELTRADFAGQDALAALWFRVDLVARLSAQAREVVLFPRAEIAERLTELVGIDISAGPPRYTIVAEGVDTHRSDMAATALGSETAPAILAALDAELAVLPPQRHGLPLAVTVGRMHEMKGMARVVAAFATDSDLAVAANLVIIGGDLSAPTPAEMAELDRIEAILDREPGLRERVVLLGHRPNDDVAIVLAAAQAGWGKHIGAGGAYVSGSRKEEFGLAIVEAMAAGLPVVAPLEGGPASYVEPGRTGELVDTSDPRAIAAGLRQTLALAADRRTAKLTREAVEDRYTIDRMARTLAAVYRVSTGASTLSLPVAEASAA